MPDSRVDLADPAVRAEWLAGLHSHAADMAGAALDATEPAGRRDLGRREARRIIRESERAITASFDAVGYVASDARPPAMRANPSAAPRRDDDDARGVATLGTAALDFACAHTDSDRDDALQEMPLAGVLFLALTGSRGERAEVDPPLLQALCALRDTADGWLDAPSNRTDRASISRADLDLFVRHVEATIEIARRGGMGGAP